MTETNEKSGESSTALAPAPLVVTPPVTKEFNAILGIKPKTIAEALEMAKLIADSDLVPKDFKGKPGNVLIGWEISNSLGIPPIQGLQNIAVINGKATLWGELGTAIVRAHPLTEWLQMSTLKEVKETGIAWTRHKRKDEPADKIHEYSFSIEDAKTAGLWGKQGTWKQYPFWMLQMRANGFCFKIGAPDMLKGLAFTEEARDIIDITPESVVPVPKRASDAAPAEAAKPAEEEHPLGYKKAEFFVKKVTKKALEDESVEVKIYPDVDGAANYVTLHEGVGKLAKEAQKNGVKLSAWFEEIDQRLVIQEAKLLNSPSA